ncbi:hypothetical protein V8D89_000662, partial [Ganoderma adspersum]
DSGLEDGIEVVDDYDEFAQFLEDGPDWPMDIDIPEEDCLTRPEGKLFAKFKEKLDALTLETCECCHEQDFNMGIKDGKCHRCRADRGDPVRKFSEENNLQPALICPPCLQNLNEIEEIMIALVQPMMQVRYTKGGQLRYRDHIVNFPQDISTITSCLPRLPEEISIVIIRKENVDLSNHVDFIVRRPVIEAALRYKIAHDPNYAGIHLDEDALSQLPEHGSIIHRLPICREGRQANSQAEPAGPAEAAAFEDEDEDEDEEGLEEDSERVSGVLNLGSSHPMELSAIRAGTERVLNGQDAAPTYSQDNIVSTTMFTMLIRVYSPS